MAFFSSSNKTQKKSDIPVNTATIITNGAKIKGDIEGDDTVHIDGEVYGNIKVNNTVVVGKSGFIKGNIQAHKIISSGKIDGNIKCDELEVMHQAYITHHIKAKKVLTHGTIDGEISCESLIIEEGGFVKSKTQSKYTVVSGSIEGMIACSTLSVKATGFVKGKMMVNNISNDGGKIEGSISQFQEIIETRVKENATKDIVLKQA